MAADCAQSRVMYCSISTLLKVSLSRWAAGGFVLGSSVADLGVEDGAFEVATPEADPGASLEGPAAVAGVAAMAVRRREVSQRKRQQNRIKTAISEPVDGGQRNAAGPWCGIDP